MPKQNINSIRTYIKVSTLFTMTAKPMHVPGYAIWIKFQLLDEAHMPLVHQSEKKGPLTSLPVQLPINKFL